MKCPYINPTIQQCNNCTLPECARTEEQEAYIQVKQWQAKNPEKVKQYQKNKRDRYSPEKKQSELQRLNEWRVKNPSKVRQSVNRCGSRWRAAHRAEERERNRINYLKRKERQAV